MAIPSFGKGNIGLLSNRQTYTDAQQQICTLISYRRCSMCTSTLLLTGFFSLAVHIRICIALIHAFRLLRVVTYAPVMPALTSLPAIATCTLYILYTLLYT